MPSIKTDNWMQECEATMRELDAIAEADARKKVDAMNRITALGVVVALGVAVVALGLVACGFAWLLSETEQICGKPFVPLRLRRTRVQKTCGPSCSGRLGGLARHAKEAAE